MIRVVLFLALASFGLDREEDLRTRQRFDALRPPRLANLLKTLNEPAPLPEPPPPPPPPTAEELAAAQFP